MKKILIVDDQEGIRLLLKEVFERENFDTFLATQGFEALEMAKQIKFDVILLDIKLPLMNGVEVLRILKDTMPNISVVMMSAYNQPVFIQETLKLGAAHFFEKPFDIFEIIDVVREIIK